MLVLFDIPLGLRQHQETRGARRDQLRHTLLGRLPGGVFCQRQVPRRQAEGLTSSTDMYEVAPQQFQSSSPHVTTRSEHGQQRPSGLLLFGVSWVVLKVVRSVAPFAGGSSVPTLSAAGMLLPQGQSAARQRRP
jgi:hypothetical protein